MPALVGPKMRQIVAEESCPYCHADAQMVWYEQLSWSDARAEQKGYCSSCQARWTVHYVAHAIERQTEG